MVEAVQGGCVNDVEDMLRAATAAGPWPVSAIRDLLHEAGITRWEFDQARRWLAGQREIDTLRLSFYVRPDFKIRNVASGLWLDGHTRAELIRRVESRARPRGPSVTTTDDLMRGDGAERLAADAYAREWRP